MSEIDNFFINSTTLSDLMEANTQSVQKMYTQEEKKRKKDYNYLGQ